MCGSSATVIAAPSNRERDLWDAALAGFGGISLLQTWAFGAAKEEEGGWRAERLDFRQGGTLVGMAQVMVKPLPVVGGGLAWVNRGPLTVPGAEAEVLAALRQAYLGRGFYLRVAPPVAELPQVAGFRSTGRIGWASAVVDLARPLDAVRASLDGKWRNALKKGEKAGLDLVSGSEGPVLDSFLAAHARFLESKRLPTTVTPPLMAALARLAPAAARPVVHVARQGGEAVGGVLFVRYGDTCEYLAGHSTEAGRAVNATHVLLWRAIAEMQARGAAACDLGGLDDQRTPPGIRLFKRGLNGVPYRLAEDIEACPASPLAWAVRWKVGRALAAAEDQP